MKSSTWLNEWEIELTYDIARKDKASKLTKAPRWREVIDVNEWEIELTYDIARSDTASKLAKAPRWREVIDVNKWMGNRIKLRHSKQWQGQQAS